MLIGQQLGPFHIDRELGAGAMGAVYRARYVKTGQVVAVKVMAPGLGDNNPNAVARFEREAAILKQLSHPNIVRLFGIGKFQGTRYYAMEYITGESLDHVMSRRGRMTWEEVVELGRQLCSALQHAHRAGVVHRDLKPSNLMILPDGTLKLTDFGIAKDLDVTALTSANCTVGTASYMSPEQCKGERDISHKSDLYSLGVVFYELITGKKPFNAENAMDMFLLHVQGKFERPSRLVLDMPVWLDNLICQMLEKKPEHRPMDAGMIFDVLGSIQEKVEAQQSAGVDAVRTRKTDRPPGSRNPDAEDKEAARALLGKKGRRKPKKTAPGGPRWLRTGYLGLAAVIFGAACLLALLVGGLYFLFQPPDPHSLYARAKKLMESPNGEDHAKADDEDGPIKTYLAHYASRQDDETKQVLAWKKQCEVEQDEATLQDLLGGRKVFDADPNADLKKRALEAGQAEKAGDLTEAKRRWQAMTQDYGPGSGHDDWGLVAANHRDVDQDALDREKGLMERLKNARDSVLEPKLEGVEKDAFFGLRYDQFGDVPSALSRFEDVKDQAAKDPALRPWELLAARKVKDLKARMPKEDDPDARKKLVQKALETCQQRLAANDPFGARALASDVVALYSDDSDLKALVDQARQIMKGVGNAPAPP